MNNHDFILKFGKYKGVNFLGTPIHYQEWLLSKEWFKLPDGVVLLTEDEKMENHKKLMAAYKSERHSD